jgi:hypothetical protein
MDSGARIRGRPASGRGGREVSLAAARAEFDGEVLAAEEELVVALGPT